MARLTRPRPADAPDPVDPVDGEHDPVPPDAATGAAVAAEGHGHPDTDAAGDERGDVDIHDGAAGDEGGDIETDDVHDDAAGDEGGDVETDDVETDDIHDDAAASGGGSDAGGERAAVPPGPAWRDRRMVVAAVVAVVSLALAAVLALTSRSGGGDGGGQDAATAPATAPTSIATGGLDVPAPDGWSPAPVPQLGFGVAYPSGWEVVVLQPEMLDSLTRSDPQVTGFVEAAHAAAESGFVFYGAGEDADGRVTDLKIRAAPETGVTDVAGLEDYARQLAAEPGVSDPRIERIDGAERPTVRMRFRSTSQSEDGEQITTTGVETLVLGPQDIVWSLIVTGEDPAVVDDLTPRLLDTFTLADA